MSTSVRTRAITAAVMRHFLLWHDNYSRVELAAEVLCDSARRRCDLAGYEYHGDVPYASIGIEVKQSAGDLHSGFGLNFVFDVNYLCVPSELVGEAMIYLRGAWIIPGGDH